MDAKTAPERSPIRTAQKLKESGVDIIQLRDKDSGRKELLKKALYLRKLLSGSKTLFIINDYPDIARITDSDGLHIGQSDISLKTARSILGPGKIIGVSCHNLKQAVKAQNDGADYIGLGPIYATPTKPEYRPIGPDIIKKIKANIKIPFFVIGDINRQNIKEVASHGAKRVAVCRDILQAKDMTLRISYYRKILN